MVTRLGGGADLGFRAYQQVECTKQIFPRKAPSQSVQPIAFALGCDFRVVDPGRIDGEDQQVPHQPGQLATNRPQIAAELYRPPHKGEGRRCVLVGNGLRRVERQIAPDQSGRVQDQGGSSEQANQPGSPSRHEQQ